MKENKIDPMGSLKRDILLVEDNTIMQLIHGRILENLGYQFDLAVTAQQALWHYKNLGPYQIILLDLGLPDYGGDYVISRIRAQETSKDRTAIILLTVNDIALVKQEGWDKGAEKVLNKPLTTEEFKTLLVEFGCEPQTRAIS
jgi:CheY-like chemotaxis protein